jgi:hypothetical protein
MGVNLSHTDKIGSILLLAVAVGIFVVTADFPTGPAETGPAFYPRMIAVLIAFFALVQLGRSLRGEGVRSYELDRDVAIRVAAAFLLVVAYVLLLPWLGFVTGTVVFLIAAMRYSGVTSYGRMVLVSVGLTLVLYYTFVVFLRVPLPVSPIYPVSEYLPGLVWGVAV